METTAYQSLPSQFNTELKAMSHYCATGNFQIIPLKPFPRNIIKDSIQISHLICPRVLCVHLRFRINYTPIALQKANVKDEGPTGNLRNSTLV